MNNVTGVILNWKRPDNVHRILAGWESGGVVAEGIVWNNNPATTFRHPWASVVNASRDMGLYTRFAAASLSRYECVVIQDDDLELPVESLLDLVDAWRAEPDIIHGVFGRKPRPDGSYGRGVSGDSMAPIVLTRALVARRCYAAQFFQVAPIFADVQSGAKPAGNGEDIIFSYVAQHATGRLNRVHRLAVNELSAPHSIHRRNWKHHVAHRSRLLRACESWLKGTNG